jgi:hypothetical protein
MNEVAMTKKTISRESLIKKISAAKQGGIIAAKSWVMSVNTELSRLTADIESLQYALDRAISRRKLCEAEVEYLKTSMGVTPAQIVQPIDFHPICIDHGTPMKLIPPGISKKTQKPYGKFWACREYGCGQIIR